MAANRTIGNIPVALLFLLLFNISAAGQEDILSRKITLKLAGVPVNEALERISAAGKFRFAYEASLFQHEQKITLQAKDVRIADILDKAFEGRIHCRQVGNHLILSQKENKQIVRKRRENLKITGTVSDQEKKKPVENAAVFDLSGGRSALTDKQGRYHMELSVTQGPRGISLSRSGFADTVVFFDPEKDSDLTLVLRPVPETLERIGSKETGDLTEGKDSIQKRPAVTAIDEPGLAKALVPEKRREISRNLRIYDTRPVQLSVIPWLGTNGKISGSLSNSVSVNLLAGYSRELKGVEIGGLVNMERGDVNGFQIAGAGNQIGGTLKGVQIGGLFNYTRGPVHGVQLTAGLNHLSDSLKGIQVSGLGNVISGKMKGLQFGGLFNFSRRHVDGWQMSFITNVGKRENNGAQVCGMVNYSKENWGLQLAAIANIAKKENRGAQLAGLFNYSRKLKGFQLALVNYCDDAGTGVPIGFLSIVRHGGYYHPGISADEIFYRNISFRAGLNSFYNIFNIGIGQAKLFNFTWGFGTKIHVKKVFSVSPELTTGVVMTTDGGLRYHGLLTKFTPCFDFQIAKHFTIFTGPSINLYWYYTGNVNRSGGIAPYTFWEHNFTTGPHAMEAWIGGSLGVRF